MGAPMWPIPRALDLEAHHYPRKWFRNMWILQGSLLLFGFQLSRYSMMLRQGTMSTGEYVDWGSHDAPKRVRF